MLRIPLCLLLLSSAALAQTVVSVGESSGEGVQSADVSAATQLGVYSKLVADQMGAAHPLPLIISHPFGTVFSTFGRFRLDPNLHAHNLAISGADVTDVLEKVPTLPVDSETDLILSPYSGSQVEIAESLSPDLTLCWVGNNDSLGAILPFDQLDASQLTSVSTFQTKFHEIAQRLSAASDKVVFANLPNLTNIAFTFDAAELAEYAGSDFGLPAGYRTSLVTATALRTGLVDGSVLDDPNWVLDPTEIATIQQRIEDFNQIIADEAAAVDAPVVDIAALFDDIEQNGYNLFGLTLTNDFRGGVFSLDGVHPTNIGHAIIANEFIAKLNSHYSMSIPALSPLQLALILFTDPEIDKDGDGRVTGRAFAGLLETVAPALGVSGDLNDFVADAPFNLSQSNGKSFVRQVEGSAGLTSWGKTLQQRALSASSRAFGSLE